jgi:hypothetical protein
MLLLVEVAAQQRGLGVHGPASQALSAPVNDVTSDPKKAKAFFATLSKVSQCIHAVIGTIFLRITAKVLF